MPKYKLLQVKTEKYNITGMACSACVAHVEKAVRKLDGVQDVNVSLLTNCMSVKFDENKLSSKILLTLFKIQDMALFDTA